MRRQEFDSLVQRLEQRYAGRQQALQRDTLAWLATIVVLQLSWLGFCLTVSAY